MVRREWRTRPMLQARWPVAKAWPVIGSILENPLYAILAAILPHKTLTTLLSHLNVVQLNNGKITNTSTTLAEFGD